MAENYSLGQGFGFNISKKPINADTVKHAVQNIDEAVGNLFDGATNYVDKYEDVFNGNVEREINMYTRQAMIVGMSLRAEGERKPQFDTNI